MWGPRGTALLAALADPALARHRGSRRSYLAANQTEPVLAYLRGAGVSASLAAQLVGDGAGDPKGGLRQVLGHSRLRRDRLERLADALDSEFLRGVLSEDVWYDKIVAVQPAEHRRLYDIEVAEHHTLVANDVVAHNCAPPFRQAEFDIMYGKGISREGSLLDIGVELGFIKKSGAWFTYEGEQLGQGRENAKGFLIENPELLVEIHEKILKQVGIGAVDEDEAAREGDLDGALDPLDEPISLSD
jgi:hypothetical protein